MEESKHHNIKNQIRMTRFTGHDESTLLAISVLMTITKQKHTYIIRRIHQHVSVSGSFSPLIFVGSKSRLSGILTQQLQNEAYSRPNTYGINRINMYCVSQQSFNLKKTQTIYSNAKKSSLFRSNFLNTMHVIWKYVNTLSLSDDRH